MKKERELVHAMKEALENAAREIGMYVRITDEAEGFTRVDLFHGKGFNIYTSYDEVSSIFGFIRGFERCLLIERGSAK